MLIVETLNLSGMAKMIHNLMKSSKSWSSLKFEKIQFSKSMFRRKK